MPLVTDLWPFAGFYWSRHTRQFILVGYWEKAPQDCTPSDSFLFCGCCSLCMYPTMYLQYNESYSIIVSKTETVNLNHLLVIHTMLLLVQATSLSVAINSYNNVLITIMVSNNFVELKGSVFKKFETNNLFQMACSGEVITTCRV